MNEHLTVWVHGLLADDRSRLVAALDRGDSTVATVAWVGPRLEDLSDHTDADIQEFEEWPDPREVVAEDVLVVEASGMAPDELAARLRGRRDGCTVILRQDEEWSADLQIAQPAVHAEDGRPPRSGPGRWSGKAAWLHVSPGMAGDLAEGLGWFADYWVTESEAPRSARGSEVLSVEDVHDLADAHRCEWPSDSLFVVDGRGMSHETLRGVLDAVPLSDGFEFQGIDCSEWNYNRILVLRGAEDLGADWSAFARPS